MICTQTQSIDISNIILKFPTKSSSTEECFFKLFISEYLFCCGGNDEIKCGRFFTNYTLITTFDLDFPGQNIKLNFFTEANTHIIFLFITKIQEINYMNILFFYQSVKTLIIV